MAELADDGRNPQGCGDASTLRRSRGRPPRGSNNQVARLLMEATEDLLRDNEHQVLTERQISEAAGVDGRMIHYYFGNKDGLIFDVIARYNDEIAERLTALESIDLHAPDVGRRIVAVMMDAYYFKPWVAKIGYVEFAKGSPIKELFVRRYNAPGRGFRQLKKVFDRLVSLGIYDASCDTEQAAYCLFSIVLSTHVMVTLADRRTLDANERRRDEWVNFVAALFDRGFRTAAFRPDAVPLP